MGFTMSLFVSELAFGTGALVDAAKLGILVASLAAGLSAIWSCAPSCPSGAGPRTRSEGRE
jgi:Na+/H+ antiporter NhaA